MLPSRSSGSSSTGSASARCRRWSIRPARSWRSAIVATRSKTTSCADIVILLLCTAVGVARRLHSSERRKGAANGRRGAERRRRAGRQRRRRPQGADEGCAGDAQDRQRRPRHLSLRPALVRPDRPARRGQDDGAGQLRAEVPAGAAAPAGRRRRHRRHALLRLVVHRRRRADRHGRPLHDAGFGRRRPTRRAGSPFSTR